MKFQWGYGGNYKLTLEKIMLITYFLGIQTWNCRSNSKTDTPFLGRCARVFERKIQKKEMLGNRWTNFSKHCIRKKNIIDFTNPFLTFLEFNKSESSPFFFLREPTLTEPSTNKKTKRTFRPSSYKTKTLPIA